MACRGDSLAHGKDSQVDGPLSAPPMGTGNFRRTALLRNLIAVMTLLSFTATNWGEAPPTRKSPVADSYHGVEVIDPYRWLEGSAAPEIEGKDEALDAEVSAWIDAQNAHTREILDSIPGRKKLEDRIRELLEVGSIGTPTMRRNRYFYSKREGKQAQPIVYYRDGARGEERLLIDPTEVDPEGLTSVDWTAPNEDGSLLAFGLSKAGDENSVLYVMDVETRRWLAEEIPGKVGSVAWRPDSSGFFYRRLADLTNPYSAQIKYHELGSHHRQDKLLFEQYKEGPLATTWGPSAGFSRDGRWMVLYYWTGTDSNDLWAIDLDRWFRTGEFERREILVGEKAKSSGVFSGDRLLLQTTLDAPNGRVVEVDLHNPARDRWRVLIPERPDAVLEDASLARGILLVDYLKDAVTRMEKFDLSGNRLGEIELPGVGTAGISTRDDRTEAFLAYTSFNEPWSIYQIDLASGTRELWERPKVPVEPDSVEVKQVFFESKDGTRIPMFVVHKKGLELNGDNPTILSGYGGFGISITPTFISTMFPWFEGGGVYASANLRGGNEYGEEWRRAGMKDAKQNVFDDFIAAAEWLIKNGYTRSERLGISGGSNGGLLVGAAMTQRPELFGAVISAVPLLDMLRYQHFLMARYWVPEYGSSESAEEFEFLKAYSPYHQVKPGTKYPAALITAGENDTRVHPLHALKMTPLLREATTADPKEDPILLWVDRSSGHGGGKPLDLRVQDAVDRGIFMMRQLGMLDGGE